MFDGCNVLHESKQEKYLHVEITYLDNLASVY